MTVRRIEILEGHKVENRNRWEYFLDETKKLWRGFLGKLGLNAWSEEAERNLREAYKILQRDSASTSSMKTLDQLKYFGDETKKPERGFLGKLDLKTWSEEAEENLEEAYKILQRDPLSIFSTEEVYDA